MKIYAPVKDATGVWCSVHFKNGVGETKNPHLIEWFRTHGYRIEGEVEKEPTTVVTESIEPNFEAMNVDELRAWMKANGLGSKVKNIKNKERLIEIIRG
jgi:hypothetical protein